MSDFHHSKLFLSEEPRGRGCRGVVGKAVISGNVEHFWWMAKTTSCLPTVEPLVGEKEKRSWSTRHFIRLTATWNPRKWKIETEKRKGCFPENLVIYFFFPLMQGCLLESLWKIQSNLWWDGKCWTTDLGGRWDGEELWFTEMVRFNGANTPIIVCFTPPTWHHWTWHWEGLCSSSLFYRVSPSRHNRCKETQEHRS